MVDALAPGVLVAQAIGRWGNWFNQELFGKPTDLPWALEIDPAHRPAGYEDERDVPPDVPLRVRLEPGRLRRADLRLDRRFKLGHGRVLALYVMAYTLGRGWIEMLRIDTVELDDVYGLRFNVWTSIVLFVAGRRLLRRQPAAPARPGGVGVRRGTRPEPVPAPAGEDAPDGGPGAATPTVAEAAAHDPETTIRSTPRLA